MERKKVVIEEVRRSAELIIIRLGLGVYAIAGPRANIIKVESRPAWAATVNELGIEGYAMASPEEGEERRPGAAPGGVGPAALGMPAELPSHGRTLWRQQTSPTIAAKSSSR